jgi:hypothetical protein
MHDQHTQLPWEQPGWLEQVTAWIHAQLAARGWHGAGAVEIARLRPWSAFARVPAADGTAYFKAAAPDCRYEAALTQALARWRPDCTVPLLAVDIERGWLLSADAGPTLHAVSPSAEQLAHWLKLLPLCVELQLEMAERVQEVLALGLFDRRLAQIPRLYAELMDADTRMKICASAWSRGSRRLSTGACARWVRGFRMPATIWPASGCRKRWCMKRSTAPTCWSAATATSSPTGARGSSRTRSL